MKSFAGLLFAALLLSSAAHAQEKKPLTPQQQRMAECSTKAKGLKGEAYKNARNECLKGGADKVAEKPHTPQQQKMATCNAKAKGLKGDEFRKVRDNCLKG